MPLSNPPPPPVRSASSIGPISLPVHSREPQAQSKLEKEIAQAQEIVSAFFSPKLIKDQSIPKELLTEAHGLMFLSVYKAGFLVSAKIGTGFVIARTPSGWSAPAFLGSGGVGFGMMAGAEKVHYVIILGSRNAVATFTRGSGQLQIGSELDMSVGPVGRAASASFNFGKNGIAPNYSYSHSVGLYGGIGISSAVIVMRRKLNVSIYGPDVTVRHILSGAVSCVEAHPLWESLDSAMGRSNNNIGGSKYEPEHRSELNCRGICCHECSRYSRHGSRECEHCDALLIYTVGPHSGKRKSGKLVIAQHIMNN